MMRRAEISVFGFTIWLVIGGIIGWLASLLLRTGHQQGILANIIIGVVGAYIGGSFLGPLLRAGPMLGYSSAILGALGAISVYHLAKRITLR
jgi:uncharacterized membrane protein YeaQ/YmgE (transglycosylase-associated protein family)